MKSDDGLYGYFSSSVVQDYASENLPNLLNTCCVSAYSGADEEDKFPDKFNVQVGSLSVKFIFDYRDFTPLTQKYDDIKVERHYSMTGKIEGFLVTDKDGYKYTFGGVDGDNSNQTITTQNLIFNSMGQYTQTHPDNVDDTYNAWLLNKIESPNGDFATFEYDSEFSYMYQRSYDEYNGGLDYVNHSSFVHSYQYQLKEIRYNHSSLGYKKIVFEGNDYRQDVNGGSELNVIKIYDRQDTLIKSFNLHHSYMDSQETASGNHHPTLFSMDPTASKRLVLDSITEVYNGISKAPYVFAYNDLSLPNRFSNSQDLWGYYNGADNGTFLDFFNNDRRVDTILSQAGMLEKITYPTGGSVKFTYEHNRGLKGSEYDYSWFPKVNPGSFESIGLSNIDYFNPSGGIYGGYYKTEEFVVTSISELVVNVSLPIWDGVNQNFVCINPPDGSCDFRIRLVPIVNGSPNISEAHYIYTNSAPHQIYPGEYQLEVHTPNGWNPNVEYFNMTYPFSVSLSYENQIFDEDTVLYSAGKRIKKIEFLNSMNDTISQKHYDYNDSGVILSIPYYAVVEEEIIDPHGQPGYIFAWASAIPGKPMSTFQGNTIGYERVTEYYGDKEKNHGKTEYIFNLMKDSGDFISLPISVPTDNEWLRGLPLKIEHYKRNTDSLYQIVKSTSNRYLFADEFINNPNAPNLLPANFILMPETKIYLRDAIPETLPNIFYEKTRTNYRLPLVHLFKLSGSVSNDPFYI